MMSLNVIVPLAMFLGAITAFGLPGPVAAMNKTPSDALEDQAPDASRTATAARFLLSSEALQARSSDIDKRGSGGKWCRSDWTQNEPSYAALLPETGPGHFTPTRLEMSPSCGVRAHLDLIYGVEMLSGPHVKICNAKMRLCGLLDDIRRLQAVSRDTAGCKGAMSELHVPIGRVFHENAVIASFGEHDCNSTDIVSALKALPADQHQFKLTAEVSISQPHTSVDWHLVETSAAVSAFDGLDAHTDKGLIHLALAPRPDTTHAFAEAIRSAMVSNLPVQDDHHARSRRDVDNSVHSEPACSKRIHRLPNTVLNGMLPYDIISPPIIALATCNGSCRAVQDNLDRAPSTYHQVTWRMASTKAGIQHHCVPMATTAVTLIIKHLNNALEQLVAPLGVTECNCL